MNRTTHHLWLLLALALLPASHSCAAPTQANSAAIDITELPVGPVAMPPADQQKGDLPFTLEPIEPMENTSKTGDENGRAETLPMIPAKPQSAGKKGRQRSRKQRSTRSTTQDQPMSQLVPDIAVAEPEETVKEEKREEQEALKKQVESGTIHLGSYLEPWKGTDPHEKVEMNFDNKEITELLRSE